METFILAIKKMSFIKKIFSFSNNKMWANDLSFVMQIGLTMAGCIFFCFFVGLYIDKYIGTAGIFTTVFIILGVIGGASTVYRQIIEITEKDNKNIKKTNM